MKNKKRVIISAISIVAVVGFFLIKSVAAKPEIADPGYAELWKSDLVSSITTNGTVESAEKSNVYARSNLPVDQINVQVGDYVSGGQVLCVLDTSDLDL
ncbi:MAG: efflux RND transporter periplasmic adaptor subunit, partial [Bacteroidales bacterium]|nr:efflux RND transporter periplasmic adaptor subunit [Bacteroidales bacterium]